MSNLWGNEFEVVDNTQSILNKLNSSKNLQEVGNKTIRAKKISIDDKIALIKENVYRILGARKDNTLVIKNKNDFIKYIDTAIANGDIAVDTETNNSLDPITCKLMGLCLYTPNLKPTYIPINHVDRNTGIRLDWQLTEEDVKEQLDRLKGTKLIFHNAKFDMQVLKCTCGVELEVYWDTLIGARILDENEKAGLKEQYILHINQEQEKYSIENLFEKEEYAIFDPDLFALYAATDAIMTYELYLYQKELFNIKDNERIYRLFRDVEIPCIKVISEMELRGVYVNLEQCKRLGNKYHKSLDEMENEISAELNKYKDVIAKWRLTPDANHKSTKKNAEGLGKSKSEQLDDPINLSSPTQLAIFLYDILNVPVVNKKAPRGTGKDELTKISEQTGLKICDMLLQYKKLLKIIESFLDTLPNQVNKVTGRIHCNYNQIGADSGRTSCSNPNLQQIPSKLKDIRLMFEAGDEERDVPFEDTITIDFGDEVQTTNGWKKVEDLSNNDIIIDNENEQVCIVSIDVNETLKQVSIKVN